MYRVQEVFLGEIRIVHHHWLWKEGQYFVSTMSSADWNTSKKAIHSNAKSKYVILEVKPLRDNEIRGRVLQFPTKDIR